jgi:hypothetical protein
MPKIDIFFSLEMLVDPICINICMGRKKWNKRKTQPEIKKHIDTVFFIVCCTEYPKCICMMVIYQNIHGFKLWFLRTHILCNLFGLKINT